MEFSKTGSSLKRCKFLRIGRSWPLQQFKAIKTIQKSIVSMNGTLIEGRTMMQSLGDIVHRGKNFSVWTNFVSCSIRVVTSIW